MSILNELIEWVEDKPSFWQIAMESAGELIEEMPNSSEFLADITVLEDFAKVIRKRR